jgi:hypothetical protein
MSDDKLYGANDQQWMAEVPLDYLKEGDKFVLRSRGMPVRVATGVADMDGHSVSERYGFRGGNYYYADNPEKSYINVRWDGIEYSKKGRFDFNLPVNHSLYIKDGVVFVSKEIAVRIALDQKQNSGLRSGNALQAEEMARGIKKAELLAQVAVIQQKIREL